jgi:hypothetical protein
VERRGEPAFRFTMDDSGEISCILPGLDSIVPREMLDDLSIRLLFSYFTSIRYQEKGEYPVHPADTARRWLGRLFVESMDGERHSLQVYSLPGEGGEEVHMFKAAVRHNNDPESLTVNYLYLDVLLRGLSHYFGRDQ